MHILSTVSNNQVNLVTIYSYLFLVLLWTDIQLVASKVDTGSIAGRSLKAASFTNHLIVSKSSNESNVREPPKISSPVPPLSYKKTAKILSKISKKCGYIQLRPKGSWTGKWKPLKVAGKGSKEQCDVFEGVPLQITDHAHLPTMPKMYGGMYTGKPTGKDKITPPIVKKLKQIPDKYHNPSCHPPRYREQRWFPTDPSLDQPMKAAEFMSKLAGKHIAFLGDSVLRQVLLQLACFLKEGGYKPQQALFSDKLEVQMKYTNDTVFSRWSLSTLTTFHRGRLAQEVVSVDVLLVNMGRHYHHNTAEFKKYAKDIKELVHEMTMVPKTTQVIFVETLPGHFATPSGDLYDSRGGKSSKTAGKENRLEYSCRANSDVSSKRQGNWRNKIMQPLMTKAGIPILPLFDLFSDRSDAHLGFDYFGRNPEQRTLLDCVHFCYSKELAQPVVARVQETILAALETLQDCRKDSVSPSS